MSKPGATALTSQLIPRLGQVRRRTWLTLAAAIVLVLGLLIWATVAIIGWFFGQAQALSGNAPEAARTVMAQIEQFVPGARQTLGEFVPALRPEPPPRDVSGTDIGPVARFPGLSRAEWGQGGNNVTVRYEGAADFALVLEHYTKGFAAQGYAKNVISASFESEKHHYVKGSERVEFTITQLPKDSVRVSLVVTSPLPVNEKGQP